MRDAPPREEFESIDWDKVDRSRRVITPERVTLLVGLLVVGTLYLYDREIAHVYLVRDWRVDLLDWVFLLALVIVVAYGVVPLLRRRETFTVLLGRLLASPGVLAATGYVGLIVFLGLFGAVLGLTPRLQMEYSFNPPIGFTSEVDLFRECLGRTSGEGFDEVCHGSIAEPLGTNRRGEGVIQLIVQGARPALYVMVIGGLLVVPLATAVGVIAGLRGGVVDRLLMSYVDLQLSFPAILIYFFAFMAWGPSLLVLLLAFGLLSWGGMARLVRSEVIQRREHGHVRVARSLGASEAYIAKRHIIPNVTNTLIPAVCQLLALFVLYEAGVAFIGFYEAELGSWGSTISQSINAEVAGQHQTRTDIAAVRIWWISTFPAIALALTMVSLKVLGDGLRDVLDPRREER